MAQDRLMSAFEILKVLHVGSAFISIGGFALRGYWMLSDNPCLRLRLTRVLPHMLDTLLLGSAIGMLLLWQVNPFSQPWLTAKILALLCYIGLGMVAFRFGKTRRIRVLAFGMALLAAAYIVSVAFTISPLGLLAA